MAPQAIAAGRQEEIASGSATEEGLRNNGGYVSYQQHSQRTDAAGWFTFNYVH